MTQRLLLIRHGESVWNAEGRWQGQADPPLSARGREQAAKAASLLAGEVARIVSSDLLRASETAEIFAASLGLGTVQLEKGLREIDVGEWSGLTRAQIDSRWPGAIERWREGGSAPGGEDRDVFRERILRALTRISQSSNSNAVLVVTHAAAIGVLERYLGVHPGVSVPRLSGRWFEVAPELRAFGERVDLLAG